MPAETAIALVKLLLGLAVFAALGYIGKFYDKRIAGVLLTFPILNGIGILTGSDPLAVARSIYAVVVLNGIVLFFMIMWADALPRFRSAAPNVKLVVRLIVWTAVWFVGAPLVVLGRDSLPGGGGLIAIQCVVAAAAGFLFWKPEPCDKSASPAAGGVRHHLRALFAFWSNANGAVRLGLFAVCFGLLLFAAHAFESKWVGMFSALPVPGLFAVATLSAIEDRDYFEPMRDTVLLGPISVIAFNWIYAHIVLALPSEPFARTAFGVLAMTALLAADAMLIVWTTPRLARWVDRIQRPRGRAVRS